MKYIKIYLACFRTSISAALAYRADFLIGNLIMLLSNIVFPLVTILVYANGASFPGWDMWEVLLIQSIFSLSTAASSMISGSVLWVTMDLVREGSFETVLLKPFSPLFYITAVNFGSDNIGLFLGAFVMTIVSASHTGVNGIQGILLFILLFIVGIFVLAGIHLIMASISFKWIGNSRIPEIFGSIEEFGKYPLVIFPKSIQIVSSLVIPVAVVGFYPASALIGRVESGTIWSVFCGLVFLVFGIWLYNKMIKSYEGVGG